MGSIFIIHVLIKKSKGSWKYCLLIFYNNHLFLCRLVLIKVSSSKLFIIFFIQKTPYDKFRQLHEHLYLYWRPPPYPRHLLTMPSSPRNRMASPFFSFSRGCLIRPSQLLWNILSVTSKQKELGYKIRLHSQFSQL